LVWWVFASSVQKCRRALYTGRDAKWTTLCGKFLRDFGEEADGYADTH
jgi:hypothetical protein